ncbi:organic solute transporter subunit alpha-like isoform X2 [Limulus polyphemus]|uniref:Organic solute transporter subunit alpha-like isoform X2 n=1 Tax=Limulus polyphemus TaxID=6850 RepID=A0ABM1SWW4_LIMPO|nr:organic solute transporter subunit alpha-like isoform X2 [Limulus polyphemus]
MPAVEAKTMNCSVLLSLHYVPTVWEAIDAFGSIGSILMGVTGITTLAVLALFVKESMYLLQHWPFQYCFLTLLCLNAFPFAAGGFFVSMIFPRLAEVSKSLILLLVIAYGDGDKNMLRKLYGREMVLQGPPLCCLCFCCPKVPLTRRKFYFVKLAIYQFAVMPLLLTVMKCIGIEYGFITQGYNLSPYNAALYISTISSVSIMFGVYGLMVFSRTAAAPMKDFKIIHKFTVLQASFILIRIQLIIFDVVGQAGAFPCFYPISSAITGHYISSAVIITEVFILALIAHVVFLHPPPYMIHLVVPLANSNSPGSQIVDLTS